MAWTSRPHWAGRSEQGRHFRLSFAPSIRYHSSFPAYPRGRRVSINLLSKLRGARLQPIAIGSQRYHPSPTTAASYEAAFPMRKGRGCFTPYPHPLTVRAHIYIYSSSLLFSFPSPYIFLAYVKSIYPSLPVRYAFPFASTSRR